MPATSPASGDRARRRDQILDEERRRIGAHRNRRAADAEVPPSHGDPPRSKSLPSTSKGLK
jgi:hypothetical protein